MRVEDIRINRRFKRAEHLLYTELKNGLRLYYYPIKDIVYGYTLYYIHSGLQSCLLYGPDLMKQLDIHLTPQFITEHNRTMLDIIMKNKKNDDEWRLGELDSYWLINGLVVYKPAVERLQEYMIS